MKKFLVILMVVAMVSVLFVGCTTPPTPDPDPTPDPVPVVTAAEAVAAVKDAAIVLDLAVLTEAGDIVAFLDALADTNFTGYDAANDNAYVAAAIVGSFSAVTTVALVNTAVAAVNTAATAVTTTAAANIAAVAADKADLTLAYGGATAATVIADIVLPALGGSGSTITWVSANVAVTNAGVVTRPIYSAGNKTGNIVATITKGAATDTKTFTVIVLKKDFTATIGAFATRAVIITPTVATGYLVTDFVTGDFDMDTGTAGVQSALTFNGVIYTVLYTSPAYTVTATSNITSVWPAVTRTITLTKDGKVITFTLSIQAAATIGDSGDFIITQ